MVRDGDGFMILIFLFAGYIVKDTFSGAIPCNSDGNGTISDSGCAPLTTTPNPDGNSDEELCCNRVLYVAIVCFGVLTLPLTVCLRVCWMKKLRKREQRRLDEVRNRHGNTNRQASVFTVESDFELSAIVSPPPYESCATSDTSEPPSEPPPPYESPPPYTAKEEAA